MRLGASFPWPFSRIDPVASGLRGVVRVHFGLPVVYDAVVTNSRWVEAKRLALTCLGTEGERSYWCNRLPEIATISVADFVLLAG